MCVCFQGKLDKALPLFEESLAIRKKAFGEDHPEVAGEVEVRMAVTC